MRVECANFCYFLGGHSERRVAGGQALAGCIELCAPDAHNDEVLGRKESMEIRRPGPDEATIGQLSSLPFPFRPAAAEALCWSAEVETGSSGHVQLVTQLKQLQPSAARARLAGAAKILAVEKPL